ncbi:hypothetical protein [Caldimonas brevitalea]|uniref:Uncharacterized protein n=1 Tax=Caldimonas brevitalea TaxID=413882 RepID=A0A0G3BJ92_9BURK|nr:hypothetical protein [Caldimonas brevitalea]AKJ29519.1 hypothetical protein AAW51_2828 [Caldimonas brevitalea]
MNTEREVEERLVRIGSIIDQAADVCEADPSVPQEVKDCVRQLDEESDEAKYEYLLENDRYAIGDHLSDLEDLINEARQACERSEGVNPALGNAIAEAGREVGELRQRLH